jgi:hypothetical protein
VKLPDVFGIVACAFMGLASPSFAPSLSHATAVARVTCSGNYYRNVSGRCVHRPMKAPSAPSGATARCRDGTYSFSQHRRGTCSHHGGVAEWL